MLLEVPAIVADKRTIHRPSLAELREDRMAGLREARGLSAVNLAGRRARGHMTPMARRGSLTLALIVAALAIGVSPIAAQSTDGQGAAPLPRTVFVPGRGTVIVQPVPTDDPHAVARTVIVPGYGEVYAVPVRPKDARSARERCVDDEAAKIGGTPSDLARASIDLKCSQR